MGGATCISTPRQSTSDCLQRLFKPMLFDEQIARKPDLYPWTTQYIDAMWAGHWTPNEFDFKGDIQQFKTELTPQEQTIIVNTLSAIGQIEIAVKVFWARLGDTLKHPSITDMGLVMAGIEVIHNRSYEKLLDVLGLNDAFEGNLKLDIIRGRVGYLRKYLDKHYADNRKQYLYALILFTLFVENVSLFSQFYIILWFNRFRNVLKDTAQQVQYTKNEELIHAQIGVKLVQTIKVEYPELFDDDLRAKVEYEATEAFRAESAIVDWMVGSYTVEHLSAPLLKEYIKNRLNESLVQIGCRAVLPVDEAALTEARWMDEEVLGNGMTDFFHKRSVDYSKNHQSYNEDDLFAV